MKVSVITVCFNSAQHIQSAIESVLMQTYPNIEYIIVDGASTDATLEIVRGYGDAVSTLLSEPDSGIYDAMNKGVSLASGDVVAFLNSDDCYVSETTISDVVAAFSEFGSDYVFGDIEMIDSERRLVRYWRSDKRFESSVRSGQIPHPAFFIRRDILNRIDQPFDSSMRISADLKQQLILIDKFQAHGKYLAQPIVSMLVGGTSTSSLSAYMLGWKESRKAYNDVFGAGGFLYVFRKVVPKLLHLFRKSPPNTHLRY